MAVIPRRTGSPSSTPGRTFAVAEITGVARAVVTAGGVRTRGVGVAIVGARRTFVNVAARPRPGVVGVVPADAPGVTAVAHATVARAR